jgi:hypothetical protein
MVIKTMETKKIELRNGGHVIVDSEDYEQLSAYAWRRDDHTRPNGSSVSYATRFTKKDNGNHTRVYMHRQIMDTPKGTLTDHINHDGLDNRRANLRFCNHTQNQNNARPQKGRSSKWRGVTYYKKNRKFLSSLIYNKKRYYLGMNRSEGTMAMIWNAKAMELFGEFAYQNISDSKINNVDSNS